MRTRRCWSPRPAAQRRSSLRLEPLEERCLLSTFQLMDGGTLLQNGSAIDSNTAAYAVTSGGTLYDLDTNGKLWQLQNGAWSAIDTNSASIKLDRNGMLYDLEMNGRLWAYNNGTWTNSLAVASNISSLVGVDSSNNLWFLQQGSLNHQSGTGNNATLTITGIINVTSAAMTSDGQTLYYQQGTSITQKSGNFTASLDSAARSMVLGNDNSLYVVHTDDSLVKYANGSSVSSGLDVNVRSIALTPQGTLFDLETSGQLWQLSNGTWTPIDNPGNVGVIAGSPNGTLYDLQTSGALWKYAAGAWTQLDSHVGLIQVGPNGTLFELETGGGFWSYSAGSWHSQGNNIINFRVAADGTFYYLVTGGGALFDVNNGTPNVISTNVSSFQLGRADNLVYQLTNGNVHDVVSGATQNGAGYAAAGDGTYWVDESGTLYHFNGGTQLGSAGGGSVSTFAITADGNTLDYVAATNRLWQINNSTGAATNLSTICNVMSLAGDDTLYETTSGGQLLRYAGSTTATPIANSANALVTAVNGVVYFTNTSNAVFMDRAGTITLIDNNMTSAHFLRVSPSGALLDHDFQSTTYVLWQFDSIGGWHELDNAVPFPGTTTYLANGAFIMEDGSSSSPNLWLYNGQWTRLDTGVSQVAVANDGNIVDLEPNHQLWLYNTATGWNQLSSSVTSFTLLYGYELTTNVVTFFV
jgi:hypothetical protein